MSSEHKRSSQDVSAAQFPALREFLRGYFHQDMADEYGSTEAAARQFWQDADERQRQAVAAEWDRLAKQTSGDLNSMNRILTGKLGSAVSLQHPDDIKRVSAVFRSGAKPE